MFKNLKTLYMDVLLIQKHGLDFFGDPVESGDFQLL